MTYNREAMKVCVQHPHGFLFMPQQVADEFDLHEDDKVDEETYRQVLYRSGEAMIELSRDWERRN